ncbi:hypothetical protein C8R45DRAFT_923759 [Mycena sanguinolenta]|nr:hypothetical protein C8R45DRAFT_923759 [Mycena sanguinolenta]
MACYPEKERCQACPTDEVNVSCAAELVLCCPTWHLRLATLRETLQSGIEPFCSKVGMLWKSLLQAFTVNESAFWMSVLVAFGGAAKRKKVLPGTSRPQLEDAVYSTLLLCGVWAFSVIHVLRGATEILQPHIFSFKLSNAVCFAGTNTAGRHTPPTNGMFRVLQSGCSVVPHRECSKAALNTFKGVFCTQQRQAHSSRDFVAVSSDGIFQSK